ALREPALSPGSLSRPRRLGLAHAQHGICFRRCSSSLTARRRTDVAPRTWPDNRPRAVYRRCTGWKPSIVAGSGADAALSRKAFSRESSLGRDWNRDLGSFSDRPLYRSERAIAWSQVGAIHDRGRTPVDQE